MSLKIEMSLSLYVIDPQCVICLPYWELSKKEIEKKKKKEYEDIALLQK